MKATPLYCALIVLTLAWASPAWSASARVGSVELLGTHVEHRDGLLVATGAATLHDGTLYMRADTITLTTDSQGEMANADAVGNARLSLGSLYVVADGAKVDAGARGVDLKGAVVVYRGASVVRGSDAEVRADTPWRGTDVPEMSVLVRPAQGRIELPTHGKEY
jgi:lipopolysaccharide export system protein LptA